MERIKAIFEANKTAMLAEYPQHQELTLLLFEELSAMIAEDIGVISPIGKRYRFVFDCIANVLTKMYAENVRKKYVIDVLDTLLDDHIVQYMRSILQDTSGEYLLRLNNAKGQLRMSQWSDESSRHWSRAIGCLK